MSRRKDAAADDGLTPTQRAEVEAAVAEDRALNPDAYSTALTVVKDPDGDEVTIPKGSRWRSWCIRSNARHRVLVAAGKVKPRAHVPKTASPAG